MGQIISRGRVLKCQRERYADDNQRRRDELLKMNLKQVRLVGRGRNGGGQMVCVLAFFSIIPSSNPTGAYTISVKFVFEKNEYKRKEAHF